MRPTAHPTLVAFAFALVSAVSSSACNAAKSGGGPDAPQNVTVTVTPDDPTLYWSQSVTFQAAVTGSTNPAVTWSVEPADAGTITSAGVYTAPARSGTFQVKAAWSPTVFGTANVTVLDPPIGGVPMTTANRTSGVAPLGVFFDAVDDVAQSTPKYTFAWTSGVTQPADMEGATFDWNFGDPGAGTWATTGRSKNRATGYTAAHVYESPGTYTATLVVTDPVSLATTTYSQTITVTDPATVFASSTRYVAAPASGGSDGNPGTQAQPYATAAKAMADVASGAAKRVLFRRGDSFSIGQSFAITAAGPGLIGAYGSGAKPIMNVAEIGVALAFATRAADWRVMDLDFRGAGASSNSGPAGPSPDNAQAVNELLLRLSTQGFYVGLGWGYYGPTAAGSPHDGVFVVECDEPAKPGAYGAYLGGRRVAIMGSTFRGGTGDAHSLRMWQGHKFVVSNNDLREPGAGRHAYKVHGIEPNFPTGAETRWGSITENLFRAGASQWTVSLGSQSTSPDEAAALTHLLLERNTFIAASSTVSDLQSEASTSILRNNIFNDAAGSGITTILWQQRNGSVQTPRDLRIYNNTVYGSATLLSTDATLSNARVRNNLVATPGSAPTLVSGTPGSGFAQDHNVLTAAAAATVFTSAGTDFSLPQGSPGVDAGTPLNEVPRDFSLQLRPLGAGWDAGALESR